MYVIRWATWDGGKVKKKVRQRRYDEEEKGYAMGGAIPMEGEQSRYRPSANRAPQGMMSARGMTAGMGMAKGGMIEEGCKRCMKKKGYAQVVKYTQQVTIVDNLKKKSNKTWLLTLGLNLSLQMLGTSVVF